MERRLPQRDILLKVLVVLGLVPALALVAGSTRPTSSFYYDVHSVEGSISAGEWSTTPGIPAACLDWFSLNGNQLPDLGTAAKVGGWVTRSFSDLLSVDDPLLREFELVVLEEADYAPATSGSYGPAHNGPTSKPGQLIVVLSGSWTVTGTGSQDIIVGGPGHNSFRGGNGRDCLVGGSGTNVFPGGVANENQADLMIGGSGPSSYHGGNAKDLLVAGTGPSTLSGGNAPDVVAWHGRCGWEGQDDKAPKTAWVWSGDPAAPTVARCPAPRMAALTVEPEPEQQAEEPVGPAEQRVQQEPAPQQPEPTSEPRAEGPAPDQQEPAGRQAPPVQQPVQPVQPAQPEQAEQEPPVAPSAATPPTGEAGPTDGETESP